MELCTNVTFTHIKKMFGLPRSFSDDFFSPVDVFACSPASAAYNWIFLCLAIPSVLVKRTRFFSTLNWSILWPLRLLAFSMSHSLFIPTHAGDKEHGENFEGAAQLEASLPSEKHIENWHTRTLINITFIGNGVHSVQKMSSSFPSDGQQTWQITNSIMNMFVTSQIPPHPLEP